MKIKRDIFSLLYKEIKRKEITILLGPRQAGKTFLLQEIEKKAVEKGLRIKSFNLEIPSDTIFFNKSDQDLFDSLTKDTDVVFMDEFHYLKNASRLFKAIYDSDRNVKIFASGSSSIEIHRHLRESLAGRRLVSRIHPLNYSEFMQADEPDTYGRYIVYGGLPGLVHYRSKDEKIRILNEILETYIQKDIKSLIREENIRAFNTLLYLLAENQGQIVVVSNLAREVGLSAKTIDNHLSLLEHTYVVFPLHSFAKNIGNELRKSKKYYFYDTGIRNTILKDFSTLNQRNDSGVLNESFIFLELHKQLKPNMELKFWRNKQGSEIDFVVLKNRKPFLIEVKTELNRMSIPGAMKTFIKKYPETIGGIVYSAKLEGEMEFQGKKIFFLPHCKVSNFEKDFLSND